VAKSLPSSRGSLDSHGQFANIHLSRKKNNPYTLPVKGHKIAEMLTAHLRKTKRFLFTAGASLVLISCVSAPTALHAREEASNELDVPGGTIVLSIPQPLPVSQTEVRQWVGRAANALVKFYGRYPVKRVTIEILPTASGEIRDGVENDGKSISIYLGPDTQLSSIPDDWMLTHEMFHLSQPDLGTKYSWMSEGMADYLEPVARVHSGLITERQFWKDLVEGLPQGLPQGGDSGLDSTQAWARVYWGGCLYWLMADIGVRQATHNEKSVRDAARAVLDAGGDGSRRWTMDHLLATYDSGTGTKVFEQLHEELGLKPGSADLGALWRRLGIVYFRGQVTFDDLAADAAIRKGITRGW
jgi:hypothetical protein